MTDIPSGYTPGKWIYARDDGKACITTVARCGDYVIGLDSTPYEGGNYRDSALSPDDEACARLIALAPEMADEIVRLRALNAELLEALKDLYSIAASEGVVGDNTTLETAAAAIAKAEGRT